MASGAARPYGALSPAGCLDFLVRRAHSGGLSLSGHEALAEQVETLPWVARLALERGLGARASQLDLHQRFVAHGEDPAVLMHWLAGPASDWLGDHLRSFLAGWADPASGLQDRLDELFLEWDVPADAQALTAPSLFLGAPRDRVFEASDLPLLFDIWQTVGLGRTQLAALERLWALAVPGIGVRHIGLMLSRDCGLRINIKGLDQERLTAVLTGLGWRGNIDRAVGQFDELAGRCDGVTVALDWIAEDILPRIGFELFQKGRFADHPLSGDLCQYLVEKDCATPEESGALGRFDGHAVALTDDWPARWVLAALRRPTGCMPRAKMRMSHIKLVLDEAGMLSAKCYLACEHSWNPVERGQAHATA